MNRLNNKDSNDLPQRGLKAKYKILVVDDQDTVTDKLKAALSVDKYEVIGITRASALVTHWKGEQPPNLVVLDVYLPDDGRLMGGYRIAKKIRDGFGSAKMRTRLKMLEIPIIAYSNYAFWIEKGITRKEQKELEEEYKRLRSKFKEVGVYDFIDKNMDKDGFPNSHSIRTLAVRIEQIISSLEGEA